jgi:hypothetical protein
MPEVRNKIIVTVVGGVVQHVSGIPDNFVVEVHDYDVDSEAKKLNIDSDGEMYLCDIWKNDQNLNFNFQ